MDFTFTCNSTGAMAPPSSTQPAIIFRLEMAQPLYVIAVAVYAAVSTRQAWILNIDSERGPQLLVIIAYLYWKASYIGFSAIYTSSL